MRALSVVPLLLLEVARAAVPVEITLDGATALHRYEGHGALSAGASSRLLWDYPEPQRSEVLDFLFKPQFGASLHMLKVEVGGDHQSTDGTEPSHEHSRGDLSCTRGYELWLLKEAKARNPEILTFGLSWADPGWVGNGTGGYYSEEGIKYQVDWADCIRRETGAAPDFQGLWNEKAQPSGQFIKDLRKALDEAGMQQTKIITMDGAYYPDQVQAASADPELRDAVYGAGLHYPCNKPQPEVRDLGWTYWSSEDYSRDPAWTAGGTYWGKALSQNYVLMNMTSTISWSLIWSAYTNLVCNGAGLMRAHQPWSGNYEVSAPIWMSAHTTQFAKPGWRYLHVPGGGSGFLKLPDGSVGGTYVTLVPPEDLDGLTLVIETLANNDCVPRSYAAFDLTFRLSEGLPGPGTRLFVWATTSSAYFQQLPDVIVGQDGTFRVVVAPDSIVTLSTVAGARHGTASAIPAAAPFPIPYRDDFNGYAEDSMARYFSDQAGSFAVRGGALVQVADGEAGPNGWTGEYEPITQIGDEQWIDYAVAVDVRFSPSASGLPRGLERSLSPRSSAARTQERVLQWRRGQGLAAEPEVPPPDSAETAPGPLPVVHARVCGRIAGFPGFMWARQAFPAYCLLLEPTGAWSLLANDTALASGQQAGFDAKVPHRLTLSMAGPVIEGYLDGVVLASKVDTLLGHGNAALGCGYRGTAFDNFELTTPILMPASMQPGAREGGMDGQTLMTV